MNEMDAKLIVVGGKTSKGSVALKLPTIIGRSRKASLKIAHPMISRRHCELFEADGLLMVRDLDSLNGTVIDGRRVKQAPLPPEGEFSIGPLTFRAEYEYEGDLNALPEAVLAEPAAAIDDSPEESAQSAEPPEENTLDDVEIPRSTTPASNVAPAKEPTVKQDGEEFDIDEFLNGL